VTTTCRALAAALAATALLSAACGGSKGPEYAKDGDTGAAAPATQQSLSPNPSMGDSTAGVSRDTTGAVPAGDTTAAAHKGAGSPTTKRP
jgi:hypothetical protein